MLRVYLGLPIAPKFKAEIIGNINNLKLKDGGFTYLPVDSHNSQQKSDIFSTRLAIEVLYSLFENKLIDNIDLDFDRTKNYLLNYYQETELKSHKSMGVEQSFYSTFIGGIIALLIGGVIALIRKGRELSRLICNTKP